MTLTTKRVHVPEIGEVEVPPPPTREAFERAAAEHVEAARRTRRWPPGSENRCPACGERTFLGRDDLTERVVKPGAVLIFHGLKGARCERCGAQCLESEGRMAVEEEGGVAILADFEIKVSRIGSGTLGTYWTKDIVRNLELAPDRRGFVQVLDKRTALVTFVSGQPARSDSRKKRKGVARTS